jgi:tRNA(Arg) A34 adenosine deaminase TadA
MAFVLITGKLGRLSVPTTQDYGLNKALFDKLGDYAEAGLLATTLALARARRSSDEARIPIAGAIVVRRSDASLEVVSVGNNGRIPPLGQYDADDPSYPIGYPTDHGETATVRLAGDITRIDWANAVFVTTLSPCIMCGRTIAYLHSLGLNRLVIAEAKSFPGSKDMLEALPGMLVVELSNEYAVDMMKIVSRRYPWDWAADIGEIPAAEPGYAAALAEDGSRQQELLTQMRNLHNGNTAAALVGPNSSGGDRIIASAADARDEHGGNPCFSAVMIAIGKATATANIRESVIVFYCAEQQSVDIDVFGHSSQGACELFRPAAVLSNRDLDSDLKKVLESVAIRILTV